MRRFYSSSILVSCWLCAACGANAKDPEGKSTDALNEDEASSDSAQGAAGQNDVAGQGGSAVVSNATTASDTGSTTVTTSGGSTMPSDSSDLGTPCRGSQDCGAGQYCASPAGECLANGGTCQADIGGDCPDIFQPVCGCDGRDYENGCQAAGAGVASQGECAENDADGEDPFLTGEGQPPTGPDDNEGALDSGRGALATDATGRGGANGFDSPEGQGGASSTDGLGGADGFETDDESGGASSDDGRGGADGFETNDESGGASSDDGQGGGDGTDNGEGRGGDSALDSDRCTLDGVSYESGESGIPAADGCNTCSCDSGGLSCTEIACQSASLSCGARAGDTCADSEYCAYVEGEYCGAADAESTCEPRPDFCVTSIEPVCGCDGVTYDHSCIAAANGTGVAYAGACDAL